MKVECVSCRHTRAWTSSLGAQVSAVVFAICLKQLGWTGSGSSWVCPFCNGCPG